MDANNGNWSQRIQVVKYGSMKADERMSKANMEANENVRRWNNKTKTKQMKMKWNGSWRQRKSTQELLEHKDKKMIQEKDWKDWKDQKGQKDWKDQKDQKRLKRLIAMALKDW